VENNTKRVDLTIKGGYLHVIHLVGAH